MPSSYYYIDLVLATFGFIIRNISHCTECTTIKFSRTVQVFKYSRFKVVFVLFRPAQTVLGFQLI
jgi:hypothetical protein